MLPANYYGVVNRIPTYYYGENADFRVFLMNQGGYQYTASGSVTFQISIGQADQSPVRGEWRIGTGAATANAVSFNATTTQLLNAISGVYGSVNVATYGSTITAGYIITAATANTALTINGQSLSLTPSSTVEVLNLVTPASGVTAQQFVRLRRRPALSLTRYLNTTTLDRVSISASGPSSVCGPWYVTLPDDAKKYPYLVGLSTSFSGAITFSETYKGFFLSNSPRNSLVDDINNQGLISRMLEGGIAYSTSSAGGALPVYLRRSTSSVTLYGGAVSNFVDFQVEPWEGNGLKISARPAIASLNVGVTIAFEGLTSLLAQGRYNLGVITFSGADLEEEFREARADRVSLTLEITMEENGAKTTLLQAPASIVRNIG